MPDPRVIDPTRPSGPGVLYPDVDQTPEQALEDQVASLAVAIANLEQAVRAERRAQPVIGVQQAQTNSSGNVTFGVYQAGAGFNFFVTRLVVECATFDTTNPRTPASPYTNASFWMGFFHSPETNTVAQGQMLDFGPTTAGQRGLPAVFDYQSTTDGPMIQGGHWLVLDVHTGPGSQRISVRYQGYLIGQ